MGKFKVGDEVLLKANQVCGKHKKGHIGIISNVNYSDKTARVLPGNHSNWSKFKDLEAVMRTIDDLREGDVVENSVGIKRMCLGICGKAVFMSCDHSYNEVTQPYTLRELKLNSYTLVQPQPDKVKVIVEGKETMISRESAEALNLV